MFSCGINTFLSSYLSVSKTIPFGSRTLWRHELDVFFLAPSMHSSCNFIIKSLIFPHGDGHEHTMVLLWVYRVCTNLTWFNWYGYPIEPLFTQLPQKMVLNSKVVKSDCKIIISICKAKSVTLNINKSVSAVVYPSPYPTRHVNYEGWWWKNAKISDFNFFKINCFLIFYIEEVLKNLSNWDLIWSQSYIRNFVSTSE
jgi:hypothetical protein